MNSIIAVDRFKYKEIRDLKPHILNALRILSIRTPNDFCRLLKMPVDEVQFHLHFPAYQTFNIPKKKGGLRNISAPSEPLKSAQKKLNYYLQALYLCLKPDSVFGFVIHPNYLSGACNIVENARLHSGRSFLLNIDLLDFFPSISAARVKSLFMSDLFQFNETMCNALTLFTTYKGALPTGAPTSPVISNLICLALDAHLEKFASQNGLVYTRYADDLSFSSNNPIQEDCILDIYLIIQEFKFKVNDNKIRLRNSNQRMLVTGLIVNEKVNLNREFLKRVRAIIHSMKTQGIEQAALKHFRKSKNNDDQLVMKFICRLEGYINFIGQVRGKSDQLFIKLKSDFQSQVRVTR